MTATPQVAPATGTILILLSMHGLNPTLTGAFLSGFTFCDSHQAPAQGHKKVIWAIVAYLVFIVALV